jgi:hypothetical protein
MRRHYGHEMDTPSDSPFTLKTKRRSDNYPPHQCAASRCTAAPILDDDSHTVWPDRVPLCDRHWQLRAEWSDEAAGEDADLTPKQRQHRTWG